jgi:DNA-binding MarR family transcriptional regulator
MATYACTCYSARRVSTGVESTSELVDAFRDLLERHARITCALERRLQDDHRLGMSEFEVLERLATVDEGHSRMQEIADAVHLSQSALSRVVGRLEADGLVERCMCPTDRRGIQARITRAGRERYEAAMPTQRAVIAAVLGDE